MTKTRSNGQEGCSTPRCRGTVELIVLGKPMCFRCWDKKCQQDEIEGMARLAAKQAAVAEIEERHAQEVPATPAPAAGPATGCRERVCWCHDPTATVPEVCSSCGCIRQPVAQGGAA